MIVQMNYHKATRVGHKLISLDQMVNISKEIDSLYNKGKFPGNQIISFIPLLVIL